MDEEKEIKSKHDLVEFLKETGPLGVVYISAIFTFFIFIKSFYENPPDGKIIALYFTLALISTVIFIILLTLIYYREKKIGSVYTCHIREEKDEYDLQEMASGKIKVMCRQNLKIEVKKDNMDKFQTFYPLYNETPVKFICEKGPEDKPYIIDFRRIFPEPNGVNMPLKRQLLKEAIEDLSPILWEYEGLSNKNVIRTSIIARPTLKLKLFVSLLPNKPKPKKHQWEIVNTECQSISHLKTTECFQVGNRYCLSVEIKAKEGLRYKIFWEY